jgi:hypothetical protein
MLAGKKNISVSDCRIWAMHSLSAGLALEIRLIRKKKGNIELK